MRSFALWCLWTLPASLILAIAVGISVALTAGSLPHFPPASTWLTAIGLAAPVQPIIWLELAAWVGASRLQPRLDASWSVLFPVFVLFIVVLNSLITLLFYEGEIGLLGASSFALLGTLLLVPRLLIPRLAPGAFAASPAA